jgi:hypothetical protein
MNPLTTFKEWIMELNVGGADRVIQIVLGLALTGNIGVWGWLGIVPLAAGAIGWFPPYAMLGFNTCSMKNKT